MAIKRLEVKNFKSFDHLDIELGSFSVLIGPNASGKSNFTEIFRFLGDIERHGLKNAISMQGGGDYITNFNRRFSEPLSIQAHCNTSNNLIVLDQDKHIGANLLGLTYIFSLQFDGPNQFEVIEEEISRTYNFYNIEDDDQKFLKTGNVTFSRADSLPEDQEIDEWPMPPEHFWPVPPEKINLPKDELALGTPFFIWPPVSKAIFDVPVYDFDPKLLKRSVPISGKAELEENGQNLAIVLKDVLADDENRRKLFNLVSYLLPFVDNLKIENFMDKSLFFSLKEQYSQERFLPASMLSDGTINVIALIIALYFQQKNVLIFEEPERNIHPSLTSRLIQMFKEVAESKQIIMTTHDPQVVQYIDLKDILLVARNDEGFSTISRPQEREDLQIFLQSEIGIEELFVQGLLEI